MGLFLPECRRDGIKLYVLKKGTKGLYEKNYQILGIDRSID